MQSLAIFCLFCFTTIFELEARHHHKHQRRAHNQLQRPEDDDVDFFGLDMRADKSVQTFAYKRGRLSIYVGSNEHHVRYYISPPLTELDVDTARCTYSNVRKRLAVMFNITLWRREVADEAVKALALLDLDVPRTSVQPLPMEQIRLTVGESLAADFEPDTAWQSAVNYPTQRQFHIFTRSRAACEVMVAEMRSNPETFASVIGVEIALRTAKAAQRTINITGENFAQSLLFAQLQNMKNDDDEEEGNGGERFLRSVDLNRLTQEIVQTVVASEVVDEDFVVNEQDRVSFAQLITQQLSKETVKSDTLTKAQWASVFWQDDFARPDRYAVYLNRALVYNDETDEFSATSTDELTAREATLRDIADEKNIPPSTVTNNAPSSTDFAGFLRKILSPPKLANPFADRKTRAAAAVQLPPGPIRLSYDQVRRFLEESDFQVDWSGKKFLPKSLDLHRVNVAELRAKSTVATKQLQVRSVKLTVKLDATIAGALPSEAEKIEYNEQLDELRRKIAELEEKMDSRDNLLQQKLNETNSHVHGLNRTFHSLTEAINGKIDKMDEKMDGLPKLDDIRTLISSKSAGRIVGNNCMQFLIVIHTVIAVFNAHFFIRR